MIFLHRTCPSYFIVTNRRVILSLEKQVEQRKEKQATVFCCGSRHFTKFGDKDTLLSVFIVEYDAYVNNNTSLQTEKQLRKTRR